MTALLFDLRYAFRQLRKAPAFALTAVLTLALSIGATVAMFSFVDAVLLKPLNFRESGQLVAVWERVGSMANLYPQVGPNPRHADFWRRTSTDFLGFALAHIDAAGVSLDGKQPSFVGRVAAEPNLLKVLGVSPLLGREFRPDEGADGRDNRAIITWGLWHRLYGGDPGVLGRTVYLGTRPLEIVGVLPRDFYFPKSSELNEMTSTQAAPAIEVITPIQMKPEDYRWSSDFGNYAMIGRLKPNVTPEEAKAQLDVLDRQIVRLATGGNFTGEPASALSSIVVPLKEAIVGKSSSVLTLLFAAVLSVLLIACINLASAQLARAMARDREVAMCAALGAPAGRLLRTSLAESAVLAVSGGALGILLAELAVHYAVMLVRVAVPRADAITVSPTALAFALLCTVGATVLVGALPAARALRVAPHSVLAGSGRVTGLRIGGALRQWMVGAQVLACTTLLLLTALFSRSLVTLLQQQRGFRSDHVIMAQVRLMGSEYTDARRTAFHDAVLARLHESPGVAGAAVVSSILNHGQTWLDNIRAEDGANQQPAMTEFRWISPDYFGTLNQRLISGRALNEGDRNSKVAVINEGAAKQSWPGLDPLGRRFKRGSGTEYIVVGVVADTRSNSLRDAPIAMAFFPYWDNVPYSSFFLVRTQGDPRPLIPEMRQAIWSTDPSATIASVGPLDQDVTDSIAPERLEAQLLAIFGGAALLLALLGIYSTLTYTVERRTQEIGVLLALGAKREHVYWVTLREAALPVGLGLAGGWVLSSVGNRLVRSLLYGATTNSFELSFSVVLLFAAAALLAAYLPCRRALQIDPVIALRTE